MRKSFRYILEDRLNTEITLQYTLSIETEIGKNDCTCDNPTCLRLKEDCGRVVEVTMVERVEIHTTHPNTRLETEEGRKQRIAGGDDW